MDPGPLHRSGAGREARRALVVRAGALGDLLLLRSTLVALQSAGYRVTLLAPGAPAELLRAAGLAAEVLDWNSVDAARWLAGAPSITWAAALRVDLALAYSASAEVLAALEPHADRLIAHSPEPPGDRHAAQWLAEPLSELGLDGPSEPLKLACSPAAKGSTTRRLADSLGPGFLAIHAGSGSARKNWPCERFVELAAACSRERPWLWVAGPAEADLPVPPGALALQAAPLDELAWLLARAGVYVGNDSGISHLAAAVGAPTLALFGPTDPDVWAPVGPCVSVLRAEPFDLSSLPVADVTAAVGALRLRARGLPSG